MLGPTSTAALAGGFIALWLYDRLPFAKAAWNLLLAGLILVALYFAFAWLLDKQFRSTVSASLPGLADTAAPNCDGGAVGAALTYSCSGVCRCQVWQ